MLCRPADYNTEIAKFGFMTIKLWFGILDFEGGLVIGYWLKEKTGSVGRYAKRKKVPNCTFRPFLTWPAQFLEWHSFPDYSEISRASIIIEFMP